MSSSLGNTMMWGRKDTPADTPVKHNIVFLTCNFDLSEWARNWFYRIMPESDQKYP
jgi:hypothetical protein